MTTLFWFYQDLRLEDNRGFIAACEQALANNAGYKKVTPLYIFDTSQPWQVCGAQAWWLHHSLASLKQRISSIGGKLAIRKGKPIDEIKQILTTNKISAIYFSRAYEPHQIKQQSQLKKLCDKMDIECKQFPGSLLCEPEGVLSQQNKPFKVFTPFSKKILSLIKPLPPKKFPSKLRLASIKLESLGLDELSLCPKKPNWASAFSNHWNPGELNAQQNLGKSIDSIVEDYGSQRDFPYTQGTSRLSPHLHFGELSPQQIWHNTLSVLPMETAFPYLRQILWREFSYSLLVNWPDITKKPLKSEFEFFPWKKNKKMLNAWKNGQTGYPIVDAGMRELWTTGWMHNRVRMIVASFLTKHLRIHWIEGAKWFWNTLLDADLANNSAGWQWVAGSGTDAAPYFRIFNPVLQGEKFDPEGKYIRTWVKELQHLPNKVIHKPWEAAESVEHYPLPIVDHTMARQGALAAYESIRKQATKTV